MSVIQPVTIPKWGIEMQEGTVTEWRIAEGGVVSKGDELVDIESDKIVNTMEAPASGVLRRILAATDSTLKVGQLLGVIAPAEVSEADIEAFIAGFVPADAGFGFDDDDSQGSADDSAGGTAQAQEPEERGDSGEAGARTPAADDPAADPGPGIAAARSKASPVAKRLASRLAVDLAQVRGSGRGGRITSADVEAFHAAGPSSPAPEPSASKPAAERPAPAASEGSALPLSSRELSAARRLVASKQEIPHFYLQRDLDMRAALAAKAKHAVPLTALLLKAIAAALEERPRLNAHLVGDTLKLQQGVALNVAVETPEGLVAPLLPEVDRQPVPALADALKALAQRARDKELQAADLAPGGLTLSNLGMFGISAFTAIINPPQVAILAVGTLRELHLAGTAEPVPAMTATLSCDHRAIDGAEGARFLTALQDALNTL